MIIGCRFFMTRLLAVLGLCILAFSWGTGIQERNDYNREEALKVIHLLEKIQMESLRSPSTRPSRKAVVTENQLNDYIAYRIESEKEEILRELRLKIFSRKKIEGRILIDLGNEPIPQILNPEMVLYFAGSLETKGQAVRLHLDSLFLGEQAIQPEILDLIMAIAAGAQNEVAGTLNDWWKLPYGIRDIETDKEKLWLFY